MASYFSLRKFFGLDYIIPALAKRQPIRSLEIPSGEVCSKMDWQYIPAAGILLRVPPYHSAVLVYPSGRTRAFVQGEHYLIDLPRGYHPIQYFNLQPQHLRLREVQASSRDAWDVSLRVEMFWRVISPLKAYGNQTISASVISACQSSIAEYIQAHEHDELVLVPDGHPLGASEIASGIQSLIQNSLTDWGLDVQKVLLVERRGDRRRNEIVQQAIVQKTQIDQERALQEERSRKEQESLNLETRLTDKRRELRLKQADTAVAESNLLSAIKLREIELQRLAKEQDIQQERFLEVLRQRGKTLSDFASIFAHMQMTPGYQAAWNSEAVLEILRELASLSPGLVTPGKDGSGGEPNQKALFFPLQEQLRRELWELFETVPGVLGGLVRCSETDRYSLVIHCKGLRISVQCKEGYPHEPPRVSVEKNGLTTTAPENFKWTADKTLKDIVLHILNQPTITLPPARIKGDGHS